MSVDVCARPANGAEPLDRYAYVHVRLRPSNSRVKKLTGGAVTTAPVKWKASIATLLRYSSVATVN